MMAGCDAPKFSIHDLLVESMVSDRTLVEIDGKVVGTLTVDQSRPRDNLTIEVSKPGPHTYALMSITVYDTAGGPRQFSGHGTGTIDVHPGRSFSVNHEFHGGQLSLVLQ
jgi:hypothetical protein